MESFRALHKSAFPEAQQRRSILVGVNVLRLKELYQAILDTEDPEDQVSAYKSIVEQELEGRGQGGAQHPGKDVLKTSRVKRLMETDKEGGRECVGSAVVVAGNMVVSARHSAVDGDGNFLTLDIEGHSLTFLAASPLDDVIILRVEGINFDNPYRLASISEAYVGLQLAMLGYPSAWDSDKDAGSNDEPYVGHGVLAAFDGARRAAASYDGALPNASGGAVVSRGDTLQGVHVGDFWHEDESMGSHFAQQHPVPSEYEFDANRLWASDPSAPTPAKGATRKGGLELKMEKLEASLTQLQVDNTYLIQQVPHKTSSAIFATASAITELMKAAKLLPQGPFFAAKSHTQSKRKRNPS